MPKDGTCLKITRMCHAWKQTLESPTQADSRDVTFSSLCGTTLLRIADAEETAQSSNFEEATVGYLVRNDHAAVLITDLQPANLRIPLIFFSTQLMLVSAPCQPLQFSAIYLGSSLCQPWLLSTYCAAAFWLKSGYYGIVEGDNTPDFWPIKPSGPSTIKPWITRVFCTAAPQLHYHQP